jgi:hypothetical protein
MLADRPPAATLDHPLWGNPRETQRSVAYVSYPRRIGWGSQMPKRKRRMVRKHTVDISPCVGTALTMAVIPRDIECGRPRRDQALPATQEAVRNSPPSANMGLGPTPKG